MQGKWQVALHKAYMSPGKGTTVHYLPPTLPGSTGIVLYCPVVLDTPETCCNRVLSLSAGQDFHLSFRVSSVTQSPPIHAGPSHFALRCEVGVQGGLASVYGKGLGYHSSLEVLCILGV